MSAGTFTEYAVMDDLDRLTGSRLFVHRDQVDEYLTWLTGDRRDEMRAAAEAEQAASFPNGNAAWHNWHVGQGNDGGEQARTYRIVERDITGWRDAE